MPVFDKFEHRVGVRETDVNRAIFQGLITYEDMAWNKLHGRHLAHQKIDSLGQDYWGAPFKSPVVVNDLGISLQALVLIPHQGTGAIKSSKYDGGIYPEGASVFPNSSPLELSDRQPTRQLLLSLASFQREQRDPVIHATHIHQTGTFAGSVVIGQVHGLDEISYHRAMTGKTDVQPYTGYTIRPADTDQPDSQLLEALPPVLYNPTQCVQVLGLLSLYGGGTMQAEIFDELASAWNQAPQPSAT